MLKNNKTFSDSTNPFLMAKEIKTVIEIGYGLLFMIGVLGNSVVLMVTVTKHRRKPTPFNSMLISLAIADLLGSFFAPIVMISHLESLSWDFVGSVGCKLITSSTLLGSLASAWTIVVIALSRFCIFKSTSPIRKRRSKTTNFGIIAAWIISVIVTLPYIINVQLKEENCSINWSRNENFICSIVFLSFTSVIPIGVLCWAHMMSIKTFRHSPGIPMGQAFGIHRTKQIQKITKLFSMITTAFFVLTTPNSLFYLIIAYNKMAEIVVPNPRMYTYLYHGLYILSCFNFVINPYLYAKTVKIESFVKKIFYVLAPKPCNL